MDLGLGVGRTLLELIFGIEPNADPGAETARTACPLQGLRLADGLDEQLLNLAPIPIPLHAGEARVDHITNARHGERGLGKVGGQHHPTPPPGPKDPVLVGLGQPAKERQQLHLRVEATIPPGIDHGPNLALSGQKDEHVLGGEPCTVGQRLLHAREHTVDEVGALILRRPPTGLHRMQAARDLHDGSRLTLLSKVLGELRGLEARRGDDQTQLRATREKAMQVAQEKVDVEAALMRLIQNDGVVSLKARVGLNLGQEHAVGHEFDGNARPRLVCKPNLVAHLGIGLAEHRAEFLRDPTGHRGGCQTPRLGMGDGAAFGRSARGQRNLGQLGGLARAGLAADDDHRVLQHRLGNLCPDLRDRKVLIKGDAEVLGPIAKPLFVWA